MTDQNSGLESALQEQANQYREELRTALHGVMEVLGRARAQGFILGFQLGVDQRGRDVIQNDISVTRFY